MNRVYAGKANDFPVLFSEKLEEIPRAFMVMQRVVRINV